MEKNDQTVAKGYSRPTPRQKLVEQREDYLAIIQRIDRALELLDKHPELEEILDLTKRLLI